MAVDPTPAFAPLQATAGSVRLYMPCGTPCVVLRRAESVSVAFRNSRCGPAFVEGTWARCTVAACEAKGRLCVHR